MSDLRALTLALPQPVILVGQDARIRGINASAERLIGAQCDGWHYITALRQPAVLDVVEASLKDGGHRTGRYLGSDGARDTTWEVSARSAVLGEGRIVVLSFQDLTAVEEAEQMRRDFVANVSHEMRTPLTSLLGFIETLSGPARNDPAAQARFLGIMKLEAERLNELVEDLLSLSRVEAQERIRPTTPVVLNDLIGEAMDALMPMAGAKGVRILADMPQTAVRIIGDAGQLRQVITNLVENAIKYGVKAGNQANTVTIKLGAPRHEPALMQDGVVLSVTDQGEGIAAYHIARLTERFYRVDTHRSREVGGTGLGLAIVKHIINRHRGRFRVESELGQGTVIKVILPVGFPPSPPEQTT